MQIEGDLGGEGVNPNFTQIAARVGATLRDPRGWQVQDKIRFVQVPLGKLKAGTKPDITISLVSPKTVDAMCAPLNTNSTWSCANKDHAVLNYRRWVEATPTYADRAMPLSVDVYRAYQINHEVGHELGHGHVQCPGAGKPAPVMLQQSMGLGGCVPNVWPTVTKG